MEIRRNEPGPRRNPVGMGGEGRLRLPLMRVAGGAPEPGEVIKDAAYFRRLNLGQLGQELVPFIQKRGEGVQPEEVVPEASLDELGVDSNNTLLLVGDLERAMDYKVPRTGTLPKTVADLTDRVMLRLHPDGDIPK